MEDGLYQVLDESEQQKLQFEQQNHDLFFNGTFPDGEFWILKLVEDGKPPYYRDEPYCYYYKMQNPSEAVEISKAGRSDQHYTIQLNKAEPDTDGDARYVVTEAHDFDFAGELKDWLDERTT